MNMKKTSTKAVLTTILCIFSTCLVSGHNLLQRFYLLDTETKQPIKFAKCANTTQLSTLFFSDPQGILHITCALGDTLLISHNHYEQTKFIVLTLDTILLTKKKIKSIANPKKILPTEIPILSCFRGPNILSTTDYIYQSMFNNSYSIFIDANRINGVMSMKLHIGKDKNLCIDSFAEINFNYSKKFPQFIFILESPFHYIYDSTIDFERAEISDKDFTVDSSFYFNDKLYCYVSLDIEAPPSYTNRLMITALLNVSDSLLIELSYKRKSLFGNDNIRNIRANFDDSKQNFLLHAQKFDSSVFSVSYNKISLVKNTQSNSEPSPEKVKINVNNTEDSIYIKFYNDIRSLKDTNLRLKENYDFMKNLNVAIDTSIVNIVKANHSKLSQYYYFEMELEIQKGINLSQSKFKVYVNHSENSFDEILLITENDTLLYNFKSGDKLQELGLEYFYSYPTFNPFAYLFGLLHGKVFLEKKNGQSRIVHAYTSQGYDYKGEVVYDGNMPIPASITEIETFQELQRIRKINFGNFVMLDSGFKVDEEYVLEKMKQRYEDMTPALVLNDLVKNSEKLTVYFYTFNSCPPCQMFKKYITKLKNEFESGFDIVAINPIDPHFKKDGYDGMHLIKKHQINPEIRNKLSCISYPTIIIRVGEKVLYYAQGFDENIKHQIKEVVSSYFDNLEEFMKDYLGE